MRCAWQAYLNILPIWMRPKVDELGNETLQELRLRLDRPPELVLQQKSVWLERLVTREDLSFCINAASQYSPWAATTTEQGFLTAPGGHRIGICGTATVVNGGMTGVAHPTSLCIRVARDFPGVAQKADKLMGSILILGKPGSGKTTLLRDLIRLRSNQGRRVAVVDEREELFPNYGNRVCFEPGKRTDVLSRCKKDQGIERVLRCMCPDVIAVDEITALEDCVALKHAGWCGVELLATAHAGSAEDFFSRPIYKPLTECSLFKTLFVLHADKSWHIERINL